VPDILHRLHIQKNPSAVYRALTTAEGIRGWWTRDAEMDAHPGGAAVFRFPNYGPDKLTRVTIGCLECDRRVTWRILDSLHPQWLGTRIEFYLEEASGGTILNFAHCDFAEADSTFALFNTGWAYYLVSLKNLAESGRGLPNPDIDFGSNFAATSPRLSVGEREADCTAQ
jgi:uncharacterized protein YndB with AHSA1/START domain